MLNRSAVDRIIGDGSEVQSLPWNAPQQKSLPSPFPSQRCIPLRGRLVAGDQGGAVLSVLYERLPKVAWKRREPL